MLVVERRKPPKGLDSPGGMFPNPSKSKGTNVTVDNHTAPRTGEQARKLRGIRRRSCTAEIDAFFAPQPLPARPPKHRTNRQLKPRKEDYSNEQYGWLNGERDSKAIARSHRHKPPTQIRDAWIGSEADQRLTSRPGLWIPAWVGYAVAHPNHARVLAWLLDRFENVNGHSEQCRARIVDYEEYRWWATTAPQIAEDTKLDLQAVKRSLNWLVKKGLIERRSNGSQGTWLRPLAKPLLRAHDKYTAKYTGLENHQDELKLADDDLQWQDSIGRDLAMGSGTQGVRVPHVLMAICDGKAGPAALLANLVYWARRSTLLRRDDDGQDYLWVAKSCRQLAYELGHHKDTVRGWLQWLIERGFVVCRYDWIWDHRQDTGQPTQHIRLVPEAIGQALAGSNNDNWDAVT